LPVYYIGNSLLGKQVARWLRHPGLEHPEGGPGRVQEGPAGSQSVAAREEGDGRGVPPAFLAL
jgi:hypothetical protein